MTIEELKNYPTVIDNNHESLYRSYQLMEKVITMLERGDSTETIFEIIQEVIKEPNH